MAPKQKQKAIQSHKKVSRGQFLLNVAAHKRLLLLLLAAFLTLIIIPKGGLIPDHYQPGDIALRDIKTPRGVLVPEPALTEKKKQDAESAVVPVYDYDSRPSKAVAGRLAEVLQQLNLEAKWVEERAAAEAKVVAEVAVAQPDPLVETADGGNGILIDAELNPLPLGLRLMFKRLLVLNSMKIRLLYSNVLQLTLSLLPCLAVKFAVLWDEKLLVIWICLRPIGKGRSLSAILRHKRNMT